MRIARLCLTGCAFFLSCAAPGGNVPQGLDAPTAANQPQAIRTPQTTAEAKIESRLLATILQETTGETVAPAPRPAQLDVDESQRVLVDIRANVSDELTRAITDANGLVVSQFPQFEAIRARLGLAAILKIAERPDVNAIRIAEQGVTQSNK